MHKLKVLCIKVGSGHRMTLGFLRFQDNRIVGLTAGVIALSLGLAGCQGMPGDGPLTSEIVAKSDLTKPEVHVKGAAVFDVVKVTASTARLVSNYETMLLQRRFGIGGGVQQPVIGVGDALKVTIFEAGENGLFSTRESKQTAIDIVIQPSGKTSLPYVGQIDFRGKTLEQARLAILTELTGKAVEPDVIVSHTNLASRNVSVSGAVGKPSVVPLGLRSETIMEALAKAGGPSGQPYESYVTLVRGQKNGTVLLKSLIDSPKENIYVRPGDQLFVTRDPRTFTVLGAIKRNDRIEFGSNDLNLLEAVALGQGAEQSTADMKGYFIFRFEEPDIVMDLLGKPRFHKLVETGMQPDKIGRYPIVYQFDMSNPDSLIVGQTFPIKNRDVIYTSRHPSVDFLKFMNIIGRPVGVAAGVVSVTDDLSKL